MDTTSLSYEKILKNIFNIIIFLKKRILFLYLPPDNF